MAQNKKLILTAGPSITNLEKKYIKIKMKDINNFLDKDPFSLGKKDKNYQFRKIFNKITHHHYNKSEKYRR